MNKIFRVILFILVFVIFVEFSPLIILGLMLAVCMGKGETFKEKIGNLIDKMKRILEC